MEYILIAISFFILGIICTPFIIFFRAKRDKVWDDSNITNILRVFAHLATHPSDFVHFTLPDGSYPFWYLKCDEFDEVVKSREYFKKKK